MENRKFWKWLNQADPPEKEGAPGGKGIPTDGSVFEESGEANDAVNGRVLEIYGTIASESWFEDDVTPKMFHDELFAGEGPVTVWLSSPGGDCIAASQIYSMLMDYKGSVTIKIDGIAASAASVIAMAGTTVLMAPTSLLMIHNPMTMAFGDHNEMEKAIEMLDEVKESIINAYEIRTGLSRAKISHLMESETWMNANKAIELGFADDILQDEKKDASEVPAFSFSGKAAQVSLMNKLCKPKLVKNSVEEKAVKNKVAEKDVTECTRIVDLEKRLNLLK